MAMRYMARSGGCMVACGGCISAISMAQMPNDQIST